MIAPCREIYLFQDLIINLQKIKIPAMRSLILVCIISTFNPSFNFTDQTLLTPVKGDLVKKRKAAYIKVKKFVNYSTPEAEMHACMIERTINVKTI